MPHFTSLVATIERLRRWGELNTLRVYQGKTVTFEVFVSIFMKSTMIEKKLSDHIIIVILHFWVKHEFFFNKSYLIAKNYRSFQETSQLSVQKSFS